MTHLYFYYYKNTLFLKKNPYNFNCTVDRILFKKGQLRKNLRHFKPGEIGYLKIEKELEDLDKHIDYLIQDIIYEGYEDEIKPVKKPIKDPVLAKDNSLVQKTFF